MGVRESEWARLDKIAKSGHATLEFRPQQNIWERKTTSK